MRNYLVGDFYERRVRPVTYDTQIRNQAVFSKDNIGILNNNF